MSRLVRKGESKRVSFRGSESRERIRVERCSRANEDNLICIEISRRANCHSLAWPGAACFFYWNIIGREMRGGHLVNSNRLAHSNKTASFISAYSLYYAISAAAISPSGRYDRTTLTESLEFHNLVPFYSAASHTGPFFVSWSFVSWSVHPFLGASHSLFIYALI